MLHESGLLTNLQGLAWYNNQSFCNYCDIAYTLSIHLQAPFSRQNLTPNQVKYNKAMNETWVSVEWLFNEIKITSSSYRRNHKYRLSAVGKIDCIQGHI